MLLKRANHSGYIYTSSGKCVAYDALDGNLTIHAFEDTPEIEGQELIPTVGFDKKQYLLHTQIPVAIHGMGAYPFNCTYPLDWLIRDYACDCEISEARFSFQELQFFCPSIKAVKSTDTDVQFFLQPQEIQTFEVTLDGKTCKVSFVVRSKGAYGLQSNMKTVSEIVIRFAETADFSFLQKIYWMVDSVFAFICNRRNTTCTSMTLRGRGFWKSEMFFLDRYRENPEEDEVIQKSMFSMDMRLHIDKLFQLVAEDISRKDKDDPANISILSIHPSRQRRFLIDLQQSLHITAAFEFYVKRYLPPMVEEKSHDTELKKLLQDFAATHPGKAKKKAKALLKHVVSEPALSDKIMKAYQGYAEWNALESCLPEKPLNVEALACAANDWRNELAHEKRSYAPDAKVIAAIRLLEHLNYAIVLRGIGYSDGEIQDILRRTLISINP